MKKFFAIVLLFLFSALAVPKQTLAADKTIALFDDGTKNGFDNGQIVAGYNSTGALRLSNLAYNSTGAKKILNSKILAGTSNLEFDVNLNGAKILPNDASAIVFDQGGWNMVSLFNYARNELNGWQHITVPLSSFPGLNIDDGVASLIFRFWNDKAGNYDLDNIKLTSLTQPEVPAPTNVSGTALSQTEISLSWSSAASSFDVYRNQSKIASTASKTYKDSGLMADTAYTYYIVAIEGTKSSSPSSSITVKTLPSTTTNRKEIADFESGLEGFNEKATLVPGYNSTNALGLSNIAYGDAATRKYFQTNILNSYSAIEMDINLNGTRILPNDASAVAFEQGGWRMVSLYNYLVSGYNGWQHVKIPFSSFAGLDTTKGIAYMDVRFWNDRAGSYKIDNIYITKDGTVPGPPAKPTNLTASATSTEIDLSWVGSAQTYVIFKNGTEIAQSTTTAYIDKNVTAGVTYTYYIIARNGTLSSQPSDTVSAKVPETQPTNWTAKSIDSQVMSKYWQITDANQIRSLVRADKLLGAKQIAVSTNFDYYDALKVWADVIHSEGLNIWFRGHWNDWDSWEKEEIKNGISGDEYIARTKQFIISHPELFRAGDVFTMCVESENAAWWSGIDNGPFRGWVDWNNFTRRQVTEANDAFARIGLGGKVTTNWINMNGWVAWNALEQSTADTLGQITLDHIIDWTDDIDTYSNALFSGKTFADGGRFYGYDEYYAKWNKPMMAGEWGYSTYNQDIDPQQQKSLAQRIFDEFSKRSWFVGLNYWIDVGHASRLFDTENLLDYVRRPIADVVDNYF